MTKKVDCVTYEGSGLSNLVQQEEEVTLQNLVENSFNQEKVLEKILNISEDRGTEGCTYGDTEMDSISVAFGYNLALSYIKEVIKKDLKL